MRKTDSEEETHHDASHSTENVVNEVTASMSYEHCVSDSSASDDESSSGESSHGAPSSEMLQGYNSAAALIQKQFRKSFPQISSASLMLEPSSATAIVLSAFGATPDVTEITDHEGDEDCTEHSKEEEVAKEEPRSGRALWGIAAISGTFIGATIIGGMIGGLDEDDAIAAVTVIKEGAGGGAGGGTVGVTPAQMTAITQTMAASAAQSAAGSVAVGTVAGAATGTTVAAGIVGAVTGAILGASAGVQISAVAATALAAAAIVTGVTVGLQTSSLGSICPNVVNFDIYPGRLDIYFQGPLDPFTLDEGEDLKDILVGRYNDFFGCESVYYRLMLDETTLKCHDSEGECCELVYTEVGPRLFCEFETSTHCAGCWSAEPLFLENSTSVADLDVTGSRYLQVPSQGDLQKASQDAEAFGQEFDCVEIPDDSSESGSIEACVAWLTVRNAVDGTPLYTTKLAAVVDSSDLTNPVPTRVPTSVPTNPPTDQPTNQPTLQPTRIPTNPPSSRPTNPQTTPPTFPPPSAPTKQPTVSPTSQPTNQPTLPATSPPTNQPTNQPTNPPSSLPTNQPTDQATNQPTKPRTNSPTNVPTTRPTNLPTLPPTSFPTNQPTTRPTHQPPYSPTLPPTSSPTNVPTTRPTHQPTNPATLPPTRSPTNQPTTRPTKLPTLLLTISPTNQPTSSPTKVPGRPTNFPTQPTTSTPSGRATDGQNISIWNFTLDFEVQN